MKKSLQSFWKYFLIFFVSIIYSEFVLRGQIGGFNRSSLFFLAFVPAEALFFTLFSGFGKRKENKIITPVLLFILAVFYIAQMLYYNSFGSLFSVSMAGMGTQAVGNFWWALKGTIVESIWLIILLLIPFLGSIAMAIFNWPKQGQVYFRFKAIILVSVVAFWFLGIGVLRLFGNGKQSAYYVFTNSLSDTDTTANKFGALTTSIVEAGAYYFRIGVGDTATDIVMEDTLPDISIVDLFTDIVPDNTPADTAGTEAGNEGQKTVATEPKAPERWEDSRIDFTALANMTDDKALQSLCKYLAAKPGGEKNEYTGIFEDYNLIYICAESFWTYAINEKVTPTLYKMANNGIVLNNYYNSFKNTTTNGEYAFATSLWPDTSRKANLGKVVGSFPQSATRYMPQGLGKLFKADGGTAYGFHNYKGSYYGRSSSWPNLGYECYFKGAGMKFSSAWPASDYEMMQQSVPMYINDDKFHAYYMTFSGHGAYTYTYTTNIDGTVTGSGNVMVKRNKDKVLELLGADASKLTEKAIGYLACHYELEKAMKYLLDELEAAGKLDNTVIVLLGDHYPYYLSATDRKSLAGKKIDDNFGIYESTCIMYNAGLKEPIVTDTYCCNIDILPTVLNLFNIPYDSRLMMGTDIFSNGLHKATLYNHNFITEYVKCDPQNGVYEWTDLASDWTAEQKEKYVDRISTIINNENTVSTAILKEDFFKFVYKNSGIMTPEEEAAEEARIAGLDIDDVYEDDEDEDYFLD